MQTKYLSDDEKKIGLKRVNIFQALNGMAFNFMGETPVYLLAIHFGATNIELGYISSVIFLTGFILVFLPRLLAGKNLIKVQSTAWFLRGLFVLIYLALYFLEGRPAVILILIVYTLFCTARILGAVIWNPLIKMITTTQNRGEVLAKGNIANQSASVISKLISFVITSFQFFSGVAGLLLLQVFGSILNSLAAAQLRKIPCRETVEYQKSRNLFVILGESLNNRSRRNPLLIRWISIGVMVLNGLTVVFMRKEVGFTANYVFLYTMTIALAFIAAGFFAKTFADRVGSRPLLIGFNILSSIAFLIWMLIPVSDETTRPIILYFILGFFSNFFLLSNNILIDRVLVNTMPDNDSFGYHSMINFVTAFYSLVAGLMGGLLIDLGQTTIFKLPNTFSILFMSAVILSLIMVVLSLWIIDSGSLSAKETAAILFSIDGLRAFNDIGKLKTINDPVKKKTVVLSISQNDAHIATEELKSIIASPLSPVKGEVIKSLFNHPREALLPALLNEAGDFGSYHQMKAIFALGAYSGPEVEELLLKLLSFKELGIASNAAKSLGRIGNTKALELVREQGYMATTAWDKLNYLIALKNMDPTGLIFKDIFNIPRDFVDGQFRQTYYSLVSDLLEFSPPLSQIYSSKNLKKGNGLKHFLEETRDLNYFNDKHDEIIIWFRDKKWDEIWNFCCKGLKDKEQSETPMGNLLNAVLTESKNKLTDYDDALAAIFFTYQILIYTFKTYE